VLGTDGSILGYGGRPGDVTSTPIVLRRPLRSLLGMWWPLIASSHDADCRRPVASCTAGSV
jgi:hypothetical protein